MYCFDIIAAKSDHNDKTKWLPFKVHNSDTSGIIELLYDKWLPESVKRYISTNLNVSYDIEESDYKTKNLCKLIALIHDIGKITPAFQSKITFNIENHTEMLLNNGLKVSDIPEVSRSPHDIAGQFILEERGFPKEISVIIGSHHGRTSQNISDQESYLSNYFGRRNEQENEWRKLWAEWIGYALKKTDWASIDELPKPNVKIQMILTGLLIMSDWIASNTEYFPYIDVDNRISDEECRKRIESAWNKLEFPNCWYAEKNYDLPEFFKQRFSFEPNPVQRTVMDIVSENPEEGLYIIEAPMGNGKTEAALAAAEILASKFGSGGIYFGLPTQATANGIFRRICDWARVCDKENHTIRLAHGMTELNEEYKEMFRGKASDSGDDGVIVHEWFEGRKQALLADFVIATVDQFLLASLKQKHVMLRHLGLSGKVVIIDECHAYDAYMNVYLDRTLTWMGAYKVPVIILSATLPVNRRNELIKAYLNRKKDILISNENKLAYPVITWTEGKDVIQRAVEGDISNKRITVKKVDEALLTNELLEKLSDGGCAAIIVNTVGYAQQLSKKISERLAVLHALQCCIGGNKLLAQSSVRAVYAGFVRLTVNVLRQNQDVQRRILKRHPLHADRPFPVKSTDAPDDISDRRTPLRVFIRRIQNGPVCLAAQRNQRNGQPRKQENQRQYHPGCDRAEFIPTVVCFLSSPDHRSSTPRIRTSMSGIMFDANASYSTLYRSSS